MLLNLWSLVDSKRVTINVNYGEQIGGHPRPTGDDFWWLFDYDEPPYDTTYMLYPNTDTSKPGQYIQIDLLVPWVEWNNNKSYDSSKYTFKIIVEDYYYNGIKSYRMTAHLKNGTVVAGSVCSYSVGAPTDLQDEMWLLNPTLIPGGVVYQGIGVIIFEYFVFENENRKIANFGFYVYNRRFGPIPNEVRTKAIYIEPTFNYYALDDGIGSKPNNRPEELPPPHGAGTGIIDSTPIPKPDGDKVINIDTILKNTKFISLHKISLNTLSDLGNFLWSSDFVDNIKKNWLSPFENIVSLSYIPYSVDGIISEPISIGNVATDLYGETISTYQKIDFGTVSITELYGGAPDYTNTSITIFMPYCGSVNLDIKSVMNCRLNLTYHVEIFTGCITAVLYNETRQMIEFEYSGNLKTEIPISSSSFTSFVQTLTALGGGAKALAAEILGGIWLDMALPEKVQSVQSTNLGSNRGLCGSQRPYIQIYRPYWYTPATFEKTNGFLYWSGAQLKKYAGFTKVEHVRVESLTCSESEKEEIRNLLLSGIII